jgi:hypothetical protein
VNCARIGSRREEGKELFERSLDIDVEAEGPDGIIQYFDQ